MHLLNSSWRQYCNCPAIKETQEMNREDERKWRGSMMKYKVQNSQRFQCCFQRSKLGWVIVVWQSSYGFHPEFARSLDFLKANRCYCISWELMSAWAISCHCIVEYPVIFEKKKTMCWGYDYWVSHLMLNHQWMRWIVLIKSYDNNSMIMPWKCLRTISFCVNFPQ
jgi:hypothetical protein